MKIKRFLSRITAVALSALMLLGSFSTVLAATVNTEQTKANVDVSDTEANVDTQSTGYNAGANVTVYYDNSISKWSSVYFRIGHSTYNNAYQMTKVSGTSNIYKYTLTAAWSGYEAFNFANNKGWTDSNSIYTVPTAGNTYAFTACTVYKKFNLAASTSYMFIGQSNATGTPKYIDCIGVTGKGTDGDTTASNYTTYQKSVRVASVANGTVTAKYTTGSGGTIAEGNSATVLYGSTLTITMTADTHYKAGTATVTYANNKSSTSVSSGGTCYVSGSGAGTTTGATQTVVTGRFTGNTYTVSVSAGEGGSATRSAASVTYPNTVTLTATADTGYSFTGWTITGSYAVSSGTTSDAEFVIKPQENVTATANFAKSAYSVAVVEAGAAGGTITGAGDYGYGATATITVTPPADYRVSNISDGTNSVDYTQSGQVTYTTSTITSDKTVTVTYIRDAKTTLTVTQNTAGTVTIGDVKFTETSATHQFNQSIYAITVAAPENYYISSIKVNGESQEFATGSTAYAGAIEFAADTATINVTYAEKPRIWVNNDGGSGNGYVSIVSGSAVGIESGSYVEYGADCTITVTPKNGFYIKSITEKGKSEVLGPFVDEYSFDVTQITSDREFDIVYSSNPTVTFTQTGAEGTIDPENATLAYNESQTFTITPPDGFYISAVTKTSGDAVVPSYTAKAGELTLEVSDVKSNTVIEITYTENPTITFNEIGSVTGGSFLVNEEDFESGSSVTYGSNASISITAPNGYYVASVSGAISQNNSAIENITSNQVINVTYATLPIVTIEQPQNGTITGISGSVEYGGKYTYSVTPDTGFALDHWEITAGGTTTQRTETEIELVITTNTTITAVMRQKSGINVTVSSSNTEYGSASYGPTDVFEGDTVTLVATDNGGYFLNWEYTIGGGETLTSNDNPLVLENVTGDIVATANFTAQPTIRIHYASSSDKYPYLYAYQTNSSGSEYKLTAAFPGTKYNESDFRGTAWRTTEVKNLNTGYMNELKLQLTDGNKGIPSGSGTLVMFKNTLGWSNVYCYTSSSNMWNSNNLGVTTNGATRVDMTKVDGTDYWYAYVESTSYIAFVKNIQDNYNNLYSTEACYRSDFNSSSPVFVPSTTSNETLNEVKYFSSGSWSAKPTIEANKTSVATASEVFDNGRWTGVTDVWIYNTGSTNHVTYRSSLDRLITATTATYNKGNDDGMYTEESWNAFVSAYDTALKRIAAVSYTQTFIDSAEKSLNDAYNALEYAAQINLNVNITGSGSVQLTVGSLDNTLTSSGVVPAYANSKPTVKIVPEDGYYISSVKLNSSTVAQNSNEAVTKILPKVSDGDNLTVVFTKKPYITIVQPERGGRINCESQTVDYGASFSIINYLEPASGYRFAAWYVNGVEQSANSAVITADSKISVLYEAIPQVYVYGRPNNASWGSVTKNPATDTVLDGTTVRFTATPSNANYQLAYWLVNGKQTAADGNTLDVTVNGTTTVIAVFEEVSKVRIYFGGNSAIQNLAGTKVFFVVNADTGSVYQMRYDGASKYYYADIPKNAYNLDFYASKSGTTVDTFKASSADYYWTNPAKRGSNEYTYTVSSTVGATNNGAGSWSTTTKFAKTYTIYLVDGSLAQTSTDSHGKKYKGNSTFTSSLAGTRIFDDDPTKLGEPTLSGNDRYQLMQVMAVNGDKITVTWQTQVYADTSDTDGIEYEYEVAGFVVNGVTVDATYLGKGLYQGTYTFTCNTNLNIKDFLIVPVYKHTQAYCDAHKIQMIELTVIAPTATNWGPMLSAYTWFTSGNYLPNDKWPGEPLLQSKTNEGTYVMYVETNNGSATIAGITFNNYVGTNYGTDTDDNYDTVGSQLWKRIVADADIAKSWSTETTWIQTYDYNDFLRLFELGYKNITFKFYDNLTDFSKNREHINNKLTNTIGTTYSQVSYSKIKAGSAYYNFEDDFDISPITNQYVDIFGREIDSSASKDDPLIVVRTGPVKTSLGEYYIFNHYYDKDGKYLGTSRADIPKYYLFNDDGTFNKVDKTASGYSGATTTIAQDVLVSYANHYVIYSYECETNPDNFTTIGNYGDANYLYSNASRLDGNWYGIMPGKELPVNVVAVLIKEDGTLYYVTDVEAEHRNIGVYDGAEFGNGYVDGGEVKSVVSGTQVILTATAKSGYTFVGWKSTINGSYFDSNTTVTVDIISASTFYAVFEKIAEGTFVVNHYIYAGATSNAATYIPEAHGGNANLTVSIKNETTGVTFDGTNTAYVSYTDGDILTITITTDPIGADSFFAWYTESKNANGAITFEEIGVDQSYVGSKDLLTFTFKYDTTNTDINVINLYSDLTKVSVYAKLVYKYYNRYNQLKQYVVPNVELSYEEIENNYTPSDETILKYAPQVDDYFKWTTWSLDDKGKYSATSSYAVLNATHNEKTYHAVVTNGETVLFDEWVPYNHLIEFNWNDTSIYKPLENFAYWAEVDSQGNVVKILSYNMKYYYRVTRDINVIAVTTASNDPFGIYIDDPEIHREQVTDDNGKVTKDLVYVDIINAILVNNSVAKLPTTEIRELMKDPEFASKIQYGMILVRDTTYDYNDALEIDSDAQVEYPEIYDNDQTALKDLLAAHLSDSRFTVGNYKYYNYNKTGCDLTNFNRYMFTLPYPNAGAAGTANRGASFKAYGYFVYDGIVYISNGVNISTYEKGTEEFVPGTIA